MLSKETTSEKNRLSAELKKLQTLSPQGMSTLNLTQIRTALNRMVDLSKNTVSEALLDEFVETITPVENYKFRWKLNLGESFSVHHTDLINIVADPILSFTIDFETAKSYREKRNMDHRFRKNQWKDIEVEVYL